MKILHTSDWHLGKRLGQFTRIDEQKEILEEISLIADNENPNAIIIAGDIFDNSNPSNEAMELFYQYSKKLSNDGERAVIAIAGNHDSPDKIEVAESLANECGIFLFGYPNYLPKLMNYKSFSSVKSDFGFLELVFKNESFPLRIAAMPYFNLLRAKEYFDYDSDRDIGSVYFKIINDIADKHCDNAGVNILVAHHYFKNGSEIAEESDNEEERSVSIGGVEALDINEASEKYNYIALGHIHKKWALNYRAVYIGSPLSYSFREANQKKFVSIVEFDSNRSRNIKYVELASGRKLLKAEFSDIVQAEQFLSQNSDAYIDLTIKSDEYLSIDTLNRINNANKFIVYKNFEFKNIEDLQTPAVDVNLNLPVLELFKLFYKKTNGIDANPELINFFNELNQI